MKVIWEVEDGYVGKSRPQTTRIPDEEFEDWDSEPCEIESERQEIIDRHIQEDYDALGWSIIRIEE